MQENSLLLWTKGKFKSIASSRMATCYHTTPEGMGIRAGHSINLPPNHQRKGYDAYQHTQEKPTDKTNPVSLVEGKQSFQHTHSQ